MLGGWMTIVDVLVSRLVRLCCQRTPWALLNKALTSIGIISSRIGSLGSRSRVVFTSSFSLTSSPRYQEDFGPLVRGCSCYCCKNHTRAYVHHLLVTNELLAGVLLMMHNFEHYFRFFCSIREALKNDTLAQLKELIRRQMSWELENASLSSPKQWSGRDLSFQRLWWDQRASAPHCPQECGGRPSAGVVDQIDQNYDFKFF